MNITPLLYCDPELNDISGLSAIAIWKLTSVIESAHGMILYNKKNDPQIQQWLKKNPLLPVLYIGDGDSLESIEPLLQKLHSVAERYAELPEAIHLRSQQDPYLQVLAFAWTRQGKIDLTLNPKLPLGYGYGLPDVLGNSNSEAILEGLWLSGYLDKNLAEVVYPCPHCQSIQVLLRDACSHCHHIHLITEPFIHHFACAYQAPESQFIGPQQQYHCPKCRMQLRHFGMDYDKPGKATICYDCKQLVLEPEVRGRCLCCQKSFSIKEHSQKRLFNYALNEAGTLYLFQKHKNSDEIQILESDLPLLSPYQFSLIAKRLAAIENRHQVSTLVLECALNSEGNALISSYQNALLLLELGKELARIIRDTDSITYQVGQFTLLLVGSTIDKGPLIIKRLSERLAKTFDFDPSERLQFHYYPVSQRYLTEKATEE